MTLKQLKTSLTRLPSDFDDYEVILITKLEGRDEFTHQLLAGLGVGGENMIPFLISEEAVRFKAKNGGLKNVDGSPVDL